jgi:RNA polymerase sigma-70 factor (ECF subfamily)
MLPRFDEHGRHRDEMSSWISQTDERLERAESNAAVRACIDRLPADYRTILMLRDIEELNTNEAARLLGLSRAAVKTRLHRARQALRKLLEPTVASM